MKAESLKVPKEPFEAVIRALLNTLPASDKPKKREKKAKRAEEE